MRKSWAILQHVRRHLMQKNAKQCKSNQIISGPIQNTVVSNTALWDSIQYRRRGGSLAGRPLQFRPRGLGSPARVRVGPWREALYRELYLSQIYRRNRPRRIGGVRWNKQAFSQKICQTFIKISRVFRKYLIIIIDNFDQSNLMILNFNSE